MLAKTRKPLKLNDMNTTHKPDSEIGLMQVDDEFIPAELLEKNRAKPYEFDERYIEAYLESPHKGKGHAFRIATGSATPFSRQRAFEMHQRLAPQINALLEEKILNATSFGLSTLFDLAENANTDSVRAMCAAKLLDAGMKVCPPVIQQNKNRTRGDIIKQIKSVKARLAELGTDV